MHYAEIPVASLPALKAIDEETKRQNPAFLEIIYSWLNIANNFQRGDLCPKRVTGAAYLEVGNSSLLYTSVNAVPNGSPNHLREYTVGRHRDRISLLGDSPWARTHLEYLSDLPRDTVMSCADLSRATGEHNCTLGLSFQGTSRAWGQAAKLCPSSIGGCTERKVLYNYPDLRRVLKEISRGTPETAVVNNLIYSRNEPPVAHITTSRGTLPIRVPQTSEDMLAQPTAMILSSTFLPCFACASELARFKNEKVPGLILAFQQYSRHIDNKSGAEVIDDNDLTSIEILAEAGVRTLYLGTRQVIKYKQ